MAENPSAAAYFGGGQLHDPMSANVSIVTALATLYELHPDAASREITLPDATREKLGEAFVIANVDDGGGYSVQVKDKTGANLVLVGPDQSVRIWLFAKATAAGTWRYAGPLAIGIVVNPPPNEFFYTLGGQDIAAGNDSFTREYQPQIDTWFSKTATPTVHEYAGGFTIGNAGHVFGDSQTTQPNNTDHQSYDPDVFTTRADLPLLGGLTAFKRDGCSQVSLQGWLDTDNTMTRYNAPPTDTFTTGFTVPGRNIGSHTGMPLGGNHWSIEGFTVDDSSDIRFYSPSGDAWTIGTDKPLPATADKPSAAFSATKGYTFGGLKTDGSNAVVDTYELEAISTGVWTGKTDFPGTARTNHGGAPVNSLIYIAGGDPNNASLAFDELWEFDPAGGFGGTWTQRGDMPEANTKFYESCLAISSS